METDRESRSVGVVTPQVLTLDLPDGGFRLEDGGSLSHVEVAWEACGLEKPDEGEISGARAFSVVFQEDRLMPSMTALENVAAVSDEACARRILARLGLEDSLDKYPVELSGGMSRRVAAARAFAFEAEGLILDEPFKGLEAELKESLAEMICDYAQKKPVILVTHDQYGKSLAKKFLNFN